MNMKATGLIVTVCVLLAIAAGCGGSAASEYARP
jgi:hypothetical protein